jgi:taurine dioxygenase
MGTVKLMDINKIAAPLGAEIRNLDVTQVTDNEWQEIHRLFLAHHVLSFPNQKLSPADQMSFAEKWGQLVRHPYAGMDDYPNIIELKNNGKRKDVNQHWHSDMTYNQAPPKLTMLYALETPEIGGDTAFSNQLSAYEELSDGLKNILADMTAEHTAASLASIYKADASEAPRATHPVIRTHDETGKKNLYVCRAFTQKFTGWTRRESQGLLETLFEHSIRPEFQARHHWRPGDLVMWDNRCVLHYAVHDHGDDPRRIHRLQVEGPEPI